MKSLKKIVFVLATVTSLFGCKGQIENGIAVNTPYACESELQNNGTDGNANGYFYENAFNLYHIWSAHVEKK